MTLRTIISIIFTILAFAHPVFSATFGPLKGVAYGSGNKAVVVVIHGDVSSGGKANYHYNFAKSVAAQNKGVTVIALLRPGYSDGRQKSKGNDNGRRDHYTKRNNDLVAQSLSAIKKTYKTRKLIVVGHSGGAAQLGVIIGRYPNLVNSAILVSGPFNIPKWRASRNSDWPKSQSPHKYIKSIPKSTNIIAINGSNDSNTRPRMAKDYIAKAQSLGLPARYIEVSNAGHGFNKLSSRSAAVVKAEIKR